MQPAEILIGTSIVSSHIKSLNPFSKNILKSREQFERMLSVRRKLGFVGCEFLFSGRLQSPILSALLLINVLVINIDGLSCKLLLEFILEAVVGRWRASNLSYFSGDTSHFTL
jgi:hypothetical protein